VGGGGSPETFATIALVVNIDGTPAIRRRLDVTNIESGGRAESISGLAELPSPSSSTCPHSRRLFPSGNDSGPARHWERAVAVAAWR